MLQASIRIRNDCDSRRNDFYGEFPAVFTQGFSVTMGRDGAFDCPDSDLIRSAYRDFRLACLGALQEVGDQPKDAGTTGIGSNAQVELSVAGIAQGGHVEAMRCPFIMETIRAGCA